MFGEDAAIWSMKEKMADLTRQHKVAVIIFSVVGILAALALIALMVSKFSKKCNDFDCCDCDDDEDFLIFDDENFEEMGVHHMEHGLAGGSDDQ